MGLGRLAVNLAVTWEGHVHGKAKGLSLADYNKATNLRVDLLIELYEGDGIIVACHGSASWLGEEDRKHLDSGQSCW